MAVKLKKMNRKTRNTFMGILVGIASIYAVINFADIPAEDIRNFIVTTLLFILAIVLLALFAVSVFKLLAFLKKRLTGETEDDWSDLREEPDQDSSNEDNR